MIMVLITLGGIAALNMTSVEFQIAGGDKRNLDDFQKAEAGLNYARANFGLIYINDDGAGNPLYTHTHDGDTTYIDTLKVQDASFNNTTALRDILPSIAAVSFIYTRPDADGVDRDIALIEVRCITRLAYTTILSVAANEVPLLNHIGPPPEGYDAKFCGRFFEITSTALGGGGDPTRATIQGGFTYPEELEKYTSWAALF